MAKYCPLINKKVVYLRCLDCDVKYECQTGQLKDSKEIDHGKTNSSGMANKQ